MTIWSWSFSIQIYGSLYCTNRPPGVQAEGAGTSRYRLNLQVAPSSGVVARAIESAATESPRQSTLTPKAITNRPWNPRNRRRVETHHTGAPRQAAGAWDLIGTDQWDRLLGPILRPS